MTTSETELARTPAVILVADLVESVSQMARDEPGTVARWRSLVGQAGQVLATRYAGRLVKSLGDGLLVQFRVARRAAEAARFLHQVAADIRSATPAGADPALRIGIHQGEVYCDELDIYGHDVNLAARVATLAGPGETVVTAAVRDALVDPLDGELEDLGECHLKHLPRPVRAWRLGPPGSSPLVRARRSYETEMLPTVAAIPFAMRLGDAADHAVGELIADSLIVQLGRGRQLRVISRLSTTTLRDRSLPAQVLQQHLGATYVLGGSYARDGSRLTLFWELSDLRSQMVVRSGQLQTSVAALLDPADGVLTAVAADAQEAILRTELQRVRTRPLPTLESFALLLGAVQLLHRSTAEDFQRSFELLGELADRHPLAPEPRIWLAKWYALRAVQGLATDRAADARQALACTARALDGDPENSLALAMEGFVHCHLTQDYESADLRLQQALALNPSETFAHLFRGVVLGVAGRFDDGLAAHDLAAHTSPLDPARYLFDSIGAYLALGAGHHEQALALARRSLRANTQHAHSWRVLAIAQAESGDLAAARQSVQQVRRLQPELTVARYLADRTDDPARRRFADRLGQAGLPPH